MIPLFLPIHPETVAQIKVGVLVAFRRQAPVFGYVQVGKMGVCTVFIIDEGYMDRITVRQELVVDTAAANDEYGGLGILFPEIQTSRPQNGRRLRPLPCNSGLSTELR